jgi:hypothetical protein
LKKRRAEIFSIVKPVVSLLLLAVVVGWIVHNGDLVARIGVSVLFYSTLISAATVVLNAAVLKLSVAYFRGRLSSRNALRLSALGTIGNALGGLPIGTTLKYALLYKESGLKISEITAGLVFFSVLTSGWLALCGLLTLGGTTLSPTAEGLFVTLVVIAVITFVVIAEALRNHRKLGPLVKPLLEPAKLWRAALLSLAITATFVLNYTVVCLLLFPEIALPIAIFIASIGTIISMGSVLQTVGGITELSMGLSALLSGLQAVTGATLALVLRLTAILAAGIVVGALLLANTRHR